MGGTVHPGAQPPLAAVQEVEQVVRGLEARQVTTQDALVVVVVVEVEMVVVVEEEVEVVEMVVVVVMVAESTCRKISFQGWIFTMSQGGKGT